MVAEAYAFTPGRCAKINLIADLLVVSLATLGAIPGRQLGFSDLVSPFPILPVVVWVIMAAALRSYDPWSARSALDDAAMLTVNVMAVATVMGVLHELGPSSVAAPEPGRFVILGWPALVTLRLLAFRPLARREPPFEDVLVIGTGPLAAATGADLARSNHRVVGYVRFPDEPSVVLPTSILGTTADLPSLLKTTPVDRVYVAGSLIKQAAPMQEVVKTCERLGISFALPENNLRLDRARPAGGSPDGYIHYLCSEPKPFQRAIKRLVDIMASAAALWILSPFLLAIILIIKLTSRGPVFFKQVRVGLYGRPFHMLKFRSMIADAEAQRPSLDVLNEQSGPVFKIRNDPRVTRIGRFIRKHSIDELPQLINVLRGDMSLVGPRPSIPGEVAMYEAWQRRRLSVRPGLTCIWQVEGRNDIPFEQWMYLDMKYIDHWSLGLDFALMLKTVPVVAFGKGAS